jgi:phosphoglycolate phosphatase
MLIVFDWDGTLCDSTARIVTAMQLAARELGFTEPSEEAVENVIGLGLAEALAGVFPALSLPQREQIRERYSSCYVALDVEPAGLFDGALETMEVLRRRGHKLAVATGKGRAGLDRVLAGLQLSDYFDGTRCADETRSKPDPLMLQELLAKFGLGVEQAVMVGDSEYDLDMARRLLVPAIGVSWGVHSVERLQQQGPVAVIDRLQQLLELDLLQ